MEPIISPYIRIRHPDCFFVGENSIIDDFCYFSTKVRIGISSHIASGCSVAGGKQFSFKMGDFSSVSSGVKIWCVSNDFINDLVVIAPQDLNMEEIHPIEGDVFLGHYTGIGANSVVMPKNHIPDGTVIGALSFVPPAFPFEPWSVYAGIPIRLVRRRNRDNIMKQIEKLMTYLDKERNNGTTT